MELHYTISKETYDRFIQERRKQRMHQPLNRFFTAFLVVFPVGLFIYAIANLRVSGWHAVLIGILAIGLSIGNYAMRRRYWRYSRSELTVMEESGNIQKDFWKEHILRVTKSGITVLCGHIRMESRWETFGGFEQCGDLLLPIFNGEPIDLLTQETLQRVGGIEAFRDSFTRIGREGIQSTAAGQQTPPEDCLISLDYSYTLETYLRDQRDARRKMYTTKIPWNRSTLVKWLLISIMIYFIGTSDSLATKIGSILAILVLGSEYLINFSPLVDRSMRRDLRPTLALQPNGLFQLYEIEDMLLIRGDIFNIDLPLNEVKAIRMIPHGFALYLQSQTILTIPSDTVTDQAAYRSLEKRLLHVCRP